MVSPLWSRSSPPPQIRWNQGRGSARSPLEINRNKWKKVKVEKWKWKSESGSESREGVSAVAWRKEIKKVKVGKSKKGASAGGRQGHMKNWKWKKGTKSKWKKVKGGNSNDGTDRRRSANEKLKVSQWKVKVKVQSVSEKWKWPWETLDLGVEQDCQWMKSENLRGEIKTKQREDLSFISQYR